MSCVLCHRQCRQYGSRIRTFQLKSRQCRVLRYFAYSDFILVDVKLKTECPLALQPRCLPGRELTSPHVAVAGEVWIRVGLCSLPVQIPACRLEAELFLRLLSVWNVSDQFVCHPSCPDSIDP